jgi:hypothetical protein
LVAEPGDKEPFIAEARRPVEAADIGGQPARDLLQYFVARGVAVTVVDLLEMVDVADNERETSATGPTLTTMPAG